jgi:anti-sigma regulatory factor (Ser/Thr protein kinase)
VPAGNPWDVAEALWTTTPDPENVRHLRREIRDYAVRNGLEPHRAQDLTLAVSEIVSNAVLHAFRDGREGVITVGAEVVGDDLVIRVVDDGIGLSPRPDSPGAGMGLMIAGSIADRLQIERPAHGGTAVCMTFGAAA